MDRYTRFRGGHQIWTNKSVASIIVNTNFFGKSSLNKFWIKISGVWKECITWIKVAGIWKQATPNIKITGNWN